MKQILLILIFSICFCCSNHKKNNFQDLNGFWLIEKAIAPNGEKKIYKNVEEVDFFEIKGEKGYRKKVISSINSNWLKAMSKEISAAFKIIKLS